MLLLWRQVYLILAVSEKDLLYCTNSKTDVNRKCQRCFREMNVKPIRIPEEIERALTLSEAADLLSLTLTETIDLFGEVNGNISAKDVMDGLII